VGREGLGAEHISEGNVEAMEDRPEEQPHARGPEVIGMEDMGPQQQHTGGQRIDMEAAVGRTHSPQPATEASAPQATETSNEATTDDAGEPGKDPQDLEKDAEKLKDASDEAKENVAKDSDGDIVVADADGQPASESDKAESTGEQTGPDAVDTTMQ
jgi:hypothetical protein